ncbi:MAG: hypothetical protein EOP22_15825 [Hyphomicrobiales bacterium]|nr:MAG: hypothetical protein EOP22_15825 [Hyphomicrobiales bacterium]
MTHRFNGLDFGPDMRGVVLADGRRVEFTRQERAVLLELARRPGTLILRDRLHTVIAGAATDTSARNVDSLISRLRQKLSDSARSPAFIATQHGEGYVWVAESSAPSRQQGMIAIGAILGTMPADGGEAALVNGLREHLADQDTAGASPSTDGPPFLVEIGFGGSEKVLDCAFALRHAGSGEILATRRDSLNTNAPNLDLARGIALWAQEAIWEHLVAPATRGRAAPADVPLELHLHDTASTLWRPADASREMERQLDRARRAHPEDPRPAIMWGLAVYTRIAVWPPSEVLTDADKREAFQAEVGEIALRHMDRLDDNSLLKLGAAKLLWLSGAHHLDLAERLALDVYRNGTAFAAAHATRGQIAMYRGDIEAAAELYDQAAQLAKYGSEFHVYLLVLKCTALLAAGDRPRLRQAMAEMFVASPSTRSTAPMMLPEEESDLSDQEKALLAGLSEQTMRTMLGYLFHATARWFVRREHRANILRPMVRHARRLHGPGIVSHEIAQSFVP